MRLFRILPGLSFSLFVLSCQNYTDVQTKIDMSLNQHWLFKESDSSQWLPATVPGCVHTDLLANKKINDPFYRTNERDLQWIDKKDWEYKTTFTADKDITERRNIELFFEGLDTYADVYLNDTLVLKADNMFRQWTVNVRQQIKTGENNLRIVFHSPIKTGLQKLEKFGFALPAINDQSENGGLGDKKVSVFTRKAGYHYGWDWGPRFVTSGIWRSVHLLAWNNARIENLRIRQTEVKKEKALLSATFEIVSSGRGKAELTISSETDPNIKSSRTFRLHPGINQVSLDFSIPHPKLWWSNGLGEAFLYSLKGELSIDGKVTDTRKEHVGIRTLKIVQKPDSAGKSFYVELNGIPVFMKGADYIPNDNFLNRVTPGKYEWIVKSAADANMNMMRVWGGGIYENDYFYDLCDKYGILLWQDFMFACSMYPGDDDFLKNVRQEVIQNVKRLRNHPSLALWCGNNEIDVAWQEYNDHGGWGWKEKYSPEQRRIIWHAYDTLFHKIIPAVIADNDDRFYWPSSPLADWGKHSNYDAKSGDVHYWGVWHGKNPFSDFKKYIGRFMSEYGFQSFPEFKTVKTYTVPSDWNIFSEVMQAHQRSSIGNATIKAYMEKYYKVPADFRKFLYVGQVLQAEGIKTAMEAHRRSMPYCMGTLFWQINDCWPVASWSSIDYEGRWKALQYFAKKAYRPVLISPDIDSTKLTVTIVSDLTATKNALLEMKIMDFGGKVISEKKLPVSLSPNNSKIYFSDEVKNVIGSASPKNCLLSVRVLEGEHLLADNILYFLPVKDLALPKTVVSENVRLDDGDIIVELSSEKLVKNLFLSEDNTEGFFTDNYFDVLPGEKVIVRFRPTEKIDTDKFLKGLTIMQMSDM